MALCRVRLDLREVGVDGAVDGEVRERAPLGVDAELRIEIAVLQRQSRVARGVEPLRARVGRDHQVRAVRQVRETRELARIADETTHVARQPGGEELVVAVTRIVAVEEDAPLWLGFVRIAQRREGDPDLEIPSGGGDLAGRLPVVVGRAVLPRGVVGHRVVGEAVGVGEEQDGGLAVVATVDEDAAVVGRTRELIVIGERRADQLGVRIVEPKTGVEVVLVIGEIADVPDLRLDVVVDIGLEPRGDRVDARPAGIGQVAVDGDWSGRPPDGQGRTGLRGGRLRDNRAGRHEHDRE
jgi:hypothetical protein